MKCFLGHASHSDLKTALKQINFIDENKKATIKYSSKDCLKSMRIRVCGDKSSDALEESQNKGSKVNKTIDWIIDIRVVIVDSVV